MLRILATCALAALALAAPREKQPRASPFGTGHSLAQIASARDNARRAAAPSVDEGVGAGAARLSVALAAEQPHSSAAGIVMVELAWSVAWEPAALQDVVVVVCGGDAADADIFEYVEVGAAESTGGRSLALARGVACSYEFRYIRGGAAALLGGGGGGGSSATRVAVAAPPPLGLDTDPVGTRIAYGDTPSEMLFTWTSLDGEAAAVVRVGTASGGPYTLVFRNDTAPRSYKADDMCKGTASEPGPEGYLFPGFFHTVRLNLTPGTRYYAVYGQDAPNAAVAPETSFVTRKAPGPDVPVRFATFGDSATYFVFPGTVTTVDLILALDGEGGGVDFVCLQGDLAYAEGSTLIWAFWTGLLFPLSSRLPLQVTVGNHETNVAPGGCNATSNAIAQLSMWQGPVPNINAYGDDCNGEAGVATFERYRGPSNGLGVFWYSYDVGSIHMTLFSSEHDYRVGSAQYEWLQRDLMAVDRTVTPWLVVAMHRPMFNPRDDGDWTICEGMASVLEPLMDAAKVDLVLSGHYHSYSRTASMRNYTVDETRKSPVYVTVGTGGATYHATPLRNDSTSWAAFDDSEWGFGVVESFNRSALRFSFRANVDGGRVHDETWLLK